MLNQPHNVEEIERKMLAALCSGSLTLTERQSFLRRLGRYDWHSPDHRVIYTALRRSRQLNRAELRQDVIAEVTRLGFPDVDITQIFVPCGLLKNDLVALVDILLSASTERRNTK